MSQSQLFTHWNTLAEDELPDFGSARANHCFRATWKALQEAKAHALAGDEASAHQVMNDRVWSITNRELPALAHEAGEGADAVRAYLAETAALYQAGRLPGARANATAPEPTRYSAPKPEFTTAPQLLPEFDPRLPPSFLAELAPVSSSLPLPERRVAPHLDPTTSAGPSLFDGPLVMRLPPPEAATPRTAQAPTEETPAPESAADWRAQGLAKYYHLQRDFEVTDAAHAARYHGEALRDLEGKPVKAKAGTDPAQHGEFYHTVTALKGRSVQGEHAETGDQGRRGSSISLLGDEPVAGKVYAYITDPAKRTPENTAHLIQDVADRYTGVPGLPNPFETLVKRGTAVVEGVQRLGTLLPKGKGGASGLSWRDYLHITKNAMVRAGDVLANPSQLAKTPKQFTAIEWMKRVRNAVNPAPDPLTIWQAVYKARHDDWEGCAALLLGGLPGFFERLPDYITANVTVPAVTPYAGWSGTLTFDIRNRQWYASPAGAGVGGRKFGGASLTAGWYGNFSKEETAKKLPQFLSEHGMNLQVAYRGVAVGVTANRAGVGIENGIGTPGVTFTYNYSWSWDQIQRFLQKVSAPSPDAWNPWGTGGGPRVGPPARVTPLEMRSPSQQIQQKYP